MAKKTKDDRIPITISLFPEQAAMIEELLRPGASASDLLEQMIVLYLTNWYFLEKEAPHEFYNGRGPVTKEEIKTFDERIAARAVQKALMSGYRKEAVAYGLLAAAHELCIRIAQDAGYVYPLQNGESLAEEMLRNVQYLMYEETSDDDL